MPLEFLLRSILDDKLASIEEYDFELRELNGQPPFVGVLPHYGESQAVCQALLLLWTDSISSPSADPIVPAQAAATTSKVTGEGQGEAESISDAEAKTKSEGN